MKFSFSPSRCLFLVGGLLVVLGLTIMLYKNGSLSLNRHHAKQVEVASQFNLEKDRANLTGSRLSGPSSSTSVVLMALPIIPKPGIVLKPDAASGIDEKNWDTYHPGMKIVAANIGAWLADPQLPQADLLQRLEEAFGGGAENADVKAEALTHWLNLQDEDHENKILGLLKPALPDETMSFLILRDSLMRSDAMQAKVAVALLASDSALIQKQALEQLEIITKQNLGTKPQDWADFLAEKYKKSE